MNNNKKAYISKVHLKGYKSIRDLEIDFKPGLNVIIGPNGSGKTNFFEFLELASYNSFIEKDFEATIQANDYDNALREIKWEGHSTENDANQKYNFYYTSIQKLNQNVVYQSKWRTFLDNRIIEAPYEQQGNIFDTFFVTSFRPTFVYYGLPNNYTQFLTEPAKIKFQKRKIGVVWSHFHDGLQPLSRFLVNSSASIFRNKEKLENIDDALNIEGIKSVLNSFTPIKDISFDKQRIVRYEEQDIVTFDNILLKFFINNEWCYWNQLSDGTKRLFYLITTIYFTVNYSIIDGSIFIEEPELGIHPDQLYLLMQFLKEEAEDKQIIITTHSPEVLNVLKTDELDRIIITNFDHEKGTQMHKLNEKQLKKGEMYMQTTGFLSNYWVHSNLEEIDETN
jgi:predicted ATPase